MAQAVGLRHVSPFTFSAGRCLIGACALWSLLPLLERRPPGRRASGAWRDPRLWRGGLLCGTALFAAETLQQFGLLGTEVGKASFITGLYVVFTPLLGLLLGRRQGHILWLAVALAVAGLWLLCAGGGRGLISGYDLLVLACALCYACHIMIVDRFAARVDTLRLSCLQFACGAVWGLSLTLVFGPPTWADLRQALGAMLYAGVLSNAIAYTLQLLGQRETAPALAALVLSLEAVFGALAGWLWLGQTLTSRELAGCALLLLAVGLARRSGPR